MRQPVKSCVAAQKHGGQKSLGEAPTELNAECGASETYRAANGGTALSSHFTHRTVEDRKLAVFVTSIEFRDQYAPARARPWGSTIRRRRSIAKGTNGATQPRGRDARNDEPRTEIEPQHGTVPGCP